MADSMSMGDLMKSVPGWIDHKQAEASQTVGEGLVFDGNARVYEWSDEYGDVVPRVPELEDELFGVPDKRHSRTGLDFSKIDSIEVSQEGPVKIDPIRSFKEAGLHPVILENVELCEYAAPTPIQKFAIPALLQGHDVIGIAQTGKSLPQSLIHLLTVSGSGKTAAYMIPIISKLMGKAKKLAAFRPNPATFMEGRDEVTAEPLVLVVVPTRELAVQIFNEARKLCYRSMLRPGVVYGGAPVRDQVRLLSKGCDILIGTPGRLIDFINRPRVLTLRRLKYMVIDEADEMLDWEEDINQILLGGDQDEGNVKYALFSATFPRQARQLAMTHLASTHVRFRVGRAGSTTENIKQMVVQAERHEKRDVLVNLLQQMHGIRTIIFCNSRSEVDYLDDFLYNMRLPVTSMHSDRSQAEREAALRAFRSGKAPILIATGVTARGIDVQNVMHVINYDLPSMEHGGIEEYTHRIGRTGRIGHRGIATALFCDRDEPIASVLTRTLLETKQDVPEFLQSYIPADMENNRVRFETESDFDEEEMNGGGGGGGAQDWGGGGDSNGADTGGAWGQSAGLSEANGNQATESAWGEKVAAPVAGTENQPPAWGGESAQAAW